MGSFSIEKELIRNERIVTRFIQIGFFASAFFLANAVFFDVAVPFFVPFWAVIQSQFPKMRKATLAGGIIGAFSLNVGQFFILIMQLLLFQVLHKWKGQPLPLAFQVLISTLTVQVLWQIIYAQGLPTFDVWMAVFLEVLLAYVMTLLVGISVQGQPLQFSLPWKADRIIASLIIVSIMVTGMTSFQFGQFSLSIFLIHLLLCVIGFRFSFATTVMTATVIGTIIAVANLSFTGMLSVVILTGIVIGLSRPLGKVGIAFISVLPSVFFFLYDATLPLDSVYFVSIAIAMGAFLMIPVQAYQKVEHYFQPSISDKEASNLVNEKIELQLSEFRRFVNFISEAVLVNTQLNQNEQNEQNVNELSPYEICQSCFRKNVCWGANREEMTQLVQHWHLYKSANQQFELIKLEEKLSRKCVKHERLIEEMTFQSLEDRISRQFYHGKKMLALQLQDFTMHLEQLMYTMQQNALTYEQTEDLLLSEINNQYESCFQVDFVSEVAGARIIKLYFSQTKKELLKNELDIIEQLNNYFGEVFHLTAIVESNKLFVHSVLQFESRMRFEVAYDVFNKSKISGTVSGDAHSIFMIHEGLVGILLSDGMGHSQKARAESEQLINWMRSFLHYQIQPETAMHTMHYMLSLKSTLDMYATFDMGLIDLQKGRLYSWKAGGMSTYIVRGDSIFKVDSYSPPIGAMPHFSVEMNEHDLKSHDMIFIVSDGIFSLTDSWQEQEKLFMQLILKMLDRHLSIQAMLYELMDSYETHFPLKDDCTIIAVEVKHVQSDWMVFHKQEKIVT